MRIDGRLPRLVSQVGYAAFNRAVTVVEGVAFWVAVALPVLYGLGLLLVDIDQVPAWLLVGLVGLNVVALVVGNRHQRPGTESRSLDGSATSTDSRSEG